MDGHGSGTLTEKAHLSSIIAQFGANFCMAPISGIRVSTDLQKNREKNMILVK
jgi:hypothetical protein